MPTSRPLVTLGLPKDALVALTRCGYENIQDISNMSASSLCQELGTTIETAETIFAAIQNTKTTAPALTQNAAELKFENSDCICTGCAPLDTLLGGGLHRGHIVEISGPPGSPKDKITTNIIKAFLERGNAVLLVACQNVKTPANLDAALTQCLDDTSKYRRLMYHVTLSCISELIVFIHHLPSLLNLHPTVSLLVIDSISFLFQKPGLSASSKNIILERFKQTFIRVIASHNLSIITTSQLATKMVNADGSAGTYETGGKGVMMPQLGPTYLPTGRSHRLVVLPDGHDSGIVKVLDFPSQPQSRNQTATSESYIIVDGILRSK